MSATGLIDHVVRPRVAQTEAKYLEAENSECCCRSGPAVSAAWRSAACMHVQHPGIFFLMPCTSNT